MEKPRDSSLLGATALIACQADTRFSYCLYVPETLDWSRRAPLIVVVHGSRRMAQQERDCFIRLADEHQAIVLAPLFPIGIGHADDTESYKIVRTLGLRYDEVLLSMVGEAAERYPIEKGRFLLHGFSGGGQFAHRFLAIHPERLLAVSIGAPGVVTLIDSSRPWWVGTRGLADVVGRPDDLDLEAMRRVPVLLVIGEQDTDPQDVTSTPVSQHWMNGINDSGVTRMDRIAALQQNYLANGIRVRLAVVPGVGHEGFRIVEPVLAHFALALAEQNNQKD